MSETRRLFFLVILAAGVAAAATFQPMQGEWRFALDAKGEGVAQKWQERRLTDTIVLPGTTD